MSNKAKDIMIIDKLFEESGWRFFDNEVGTGVRA